MRSDSFLHFLGQYRGAAILRTGMGEAVAPAMDAAVRAGFRIVEFTLNTPGALDRIAEFARRDDLLVGAGTVLTVQDAREAAMRGASFLVSPIVDEAVIQEAVSLGLEILPGCHTPTEMMRAHRAGARIVKLFPAPAAGPDFVRACLGPLPFLRIVPTNGTAENAGGWIEAGCYAVGFGASLFRPADVNAGRFDTIEERARQCLAAITSAACPLL